jgi:hypothetical protein
VTTRRHGVLVRAACTAVLAAASALLAAPTAIASEGSVPPEVSAYVADPDGLLARLDDLFGPDAGGEGIDFDETTTTGEVDRAFAFTAAYLAGEQTAPPVELVNEWTVAVTVGEQPVGLAIITINQATVRPELADFSADPALAVALAEMPDEARLVHDTQRGAWFTLIEDALTPVVPGDSGVTAPTTLSAYQGRVVDVAAAADAPEPSSPVTGLSIAVIAASLLVIIAVLVAPGVRDRIRSRRRAPAEPTGEQLR